MTGLEPLSSPNAWIALVAACFCVTAAEAGVTAPTAADAVRAASRQARMEKVLNGRGSIGRRESIGRRSWIRKSPVSGTVTAVAADR